jgi:hypothetical protein
MRKTAVGRYRAQAVIAKSTSLVSTVRAVLPGQLGRPNGLTRRHQRAAAAQLAAGGKLYPMGEVEDLDDAA